MALRPPERRRQRRRRASDRRIPPLAVAAVAGFLIFGFGVRLLLALFAVPTWTTSWQVIDLLTLPLMTPLEHIGALSPTILGHARLTDLVATVIAAFIGAFLLATLTVRRDA